VKRYAFDVELLVNADKGGYRTVEAPIIVQHGKREKIMLRDILHMAIDLQPYSIAYILPIHTMKICSTGTRKVPCG